MAALGEWKHINCLRISADDEIQDDILRKLVDFHKPNGKNVSESHPQSQLATLLSAVDIENIAALDKVLTVRDVPEGSVAFLFQRSSTKIMEDSNEIEDYA